MSLPAEVRATQRSVGERVTFTWITFRDAQFDDEESKKRTEEEVSDLQKITGPHPFSMITQEGFPDLSTGSKWREAASYTSGWSVYLPEYPT